MQQLVFVDETYKDERTLNRTLKRLKGYGAKGDRVRAIRTVVVAVICVCLCVCFPFYTHHV